MDTLRLDKLICNAFSCTRKQARKKILSGLVKVDGSVIRDASLHCRTDAVLQCGEKLGSYEQYVYIMMNKPAGVISATKDPKTKTALDILPPEMKRNNLFVAGRLDKNTTGFLLITDDGAFAHDILSPRKHIAKTYIVSVKFPLSEEAPDIFAAGMTIGPDVCKPARLTVLSDRTAEVVLEEGKFHQIKRMFAAIGNEVTALHRTQMGGLLLDKALLPGQARYITREEILKIKADEVEK